jgi:serine/threonine protein kinase
MPPGERDVDAEDATRTAGMGVPATVDAAPRTPGRVDAMAWLRPLVGTVLGERFLVLDVLGQGGMGGVLHVRDVRPPADRAPGGRFRSASDEYALKLLKHDGSAISASGSGPTHSGWRFIREYRMGLRKLSRSGRAVRSYELGTVDLARAARALPSPPEATPAPALHPLAPLLDGESESVYFTSDLIAGGALPRFAEPQPVAMVAALALELCTVLDELHELEVVHRDLKNANVLCDRPWALVRQELLHGDGATPVRFPKLLLADFGIARHGSLRDDTPLGSVVGTPAYLPPESMHIGNLDPRADLYAAGVILYEAATGQHPLRAAHADAQRMLAGEPFRVPPVRALVADFPAALAQVIEGLLEPDPLRRTRTAALAHDAVSAWWGAAHAPLLLAAQPAPRGKPYLSTPRFVGRDAELTEIRAFLGATLGFQPAPRGPDATAASEPLPAQVLVLRGEPGVGKSRLLGQIHREAHALDGPAPRVLVGQCVRGGGGPYHSLHLVLDELERASWDTPPPDPGDGHAEELATIERVPTTNDPEYAILRREARGAVEVHVQAEVRQLLFLRRVTAHVLRVARGRPLLLVQEDSQWSDESSTSLLEYLLRNVALARSLGHPAQVGFVLTQRPAAADNAVARFEQIFAAQAELERAPVRVELGGMARAESAALVASLLACEQSAELAAFADALLGGGAARPLLVEHTLRAFLAAGHLTRGMTEERAGGVPRWTGRWRLDLEAARAAPRPSSLHEAIGKHAQQLSAGTAKVLTYAAAEGRQFAVEVIARAAGEDPVAVLDYLDEAAAAGFVTDVEQLELAQAASRIRGRELVFCHDRYREAVYDALADDERAACHRRLAEALTELRGDSPRLAEALTRHHAAAGDHAAAYASAVRAAEHATSSGGYDRATDLYAAALAHAGRAGLAVATSVRDALARVAVYCGRFDVAARELETLAHDPSLAAEARWDVSLRLAELRYRKQQYRDAIAPLERVLRDMGETVPRSRLARNLLAVPHVLNIVARGLVDGAINTAPAARPALAEVRSRAWYMLAESYNFVDNKDVLFAGAVNGGQVVGRGLHGFSAPVLAGMAYLFGGQGLAMVSRRYHAACSALLDGDPGAIGAPDVTGRALAHMLLIGARQLRGELGAEEEPAIGRSVAAAIAATQESGDPQRAWLVLSFVASLHWHAGHLQSYQECLRWILRGVRASRLDTLRYLQGQIADARGHEVQGDLAAAEQAWARYSARADEIGGEYDRRLGQANLTWMRALRDDPGREAGLDAVVATAREAARACLERGFQYFEGPIVPRLLGALVLTGAADAARLVRACKKTCLGNLVQRPGYLAVQAALLALRGKHERAGRGFAAATDAALGSGLVDGVLDVYRLAARVHPAGSAPRRMYTWLEATLAARMIAAPGLSAQRIAEGGFAPRVQVPRASEWTEGARLEARAD